MEIITSSILQALFVVLALIATLLRFWVRIGIEKRRLNAPDCLVFAGWLCTLGWVICSIVALKIQIDHPLVEPDLTSDQVGYLVTVLISSYFFDIGLYFPKAALLAFYFWLIPYGFRRLRLAVYFGTAFMAMSFIASLLTDTLICRPFSDNWSIENQMNSLWNTYNALAINWALNWATDLLLFIFPFFIVNCLKLRRRQKVALCGVFSLGLVTIVISLARFLVYTISDYGIDDASGNLWCTAEICIAVIIASLPTLKVLIGRTTPPTTQNRSHSGYATHSNSHPRKSFSHLDTYHSHIQGGAHSGDDEIELVFQESRKSSPSPTRTTSGTGVDEKDGVRVTTDVTVVRDVV